MKVAFTLFGLLLVRVSLIVLSEGVGKEEEDPGEEKGHPDLQTIIIHADSSKTLQKNFDDLEDSGWLENWNVPLIIANSENGAKAQEVEKVQKRVKFLPGRFKNKKAVIHMKDENKMDGRAAEESVVDSWIVGDKGAGSGQGKEKSQLKKSLKKSKKTGKKQDKDKAFSGPEDMEKDNNMHTIIIHSDTDEAQRRYFDELEDSKAMDNWLIPRIITSADNKEKRDKMKSFRKKEHMSFRGKFANKQAVIHVREENVSSRAKEGASQGNNGAHDKDLKMVEVYDVVKFFNNTFGTLDYYWMHMETDNLTKLDKLDAGQFLPWYFTSKTVVKKPNGTYVYYQTMENFKVTYVETKLNQTSSLDAQWESVQMKSLRDFELTLWEYSNTPKSRSVLMGFWDTTCENMEWALKIKLGRSQNLAHVCLLHELRKSRFKFYTPVDAKDRDCAKTPFSCVVTTDDFNNNGFMWHSLVTVDGAVKEAKMKQDSNKRIFFSSAGGYERLVVGYFILKPEETAKFNVFKGFLYAEALVAILAFGIIMTALITFSGATVRETMFYMFAAVFEQGQRVPINAHEHGGRAFFGKVICFLWLLSWLILRQFLSGALVSNLTREDPPNSPSNQGCLIDFLKKEGAVLIEPLKIDENGWFQKSRYNMSNETGQCWKENYVTHIYENNDKDLFPELKLMACIKSAAESTSSPCKEFQNITVPFAFSYISTEKRMETMKKLAKLVDKGIFVSTSNVDTPFVKPSFFAPYDVNYLTLLLSKDFAHYFESGIFQKWEKLDQEMEGLAGCMTYELSQNQSDLAKASEEHKNEVKRRCKELLASDKKSGKEWIKQQLGSIDAIKFKEVKFPLLILCAGNFGAFLIFLVERFAPRRLIAWILDKHGKIKSFFLPKPKPRIGPMYPQDFELSDRVKRAVEMMKRREMAENLETNQPADTGAETNDQEENACSNDEDKLDDPMADLRRSATCSSHHLEEHEKERLETLLALIEAYDRLVFTDEDLELLHKSGVLMTDEEAAELAMNVSPDAPLGGGNDVQELPTDSPKKPGNVTEAWVEQEQKPNKTGADSQDQSPQPGPTRPRFWEEDLGEIFTPGRSSESDSD